MRERSADVDREFITYEELEDRIAYCEECAAETDKWPVYKDGKNTGEYHDVPSEWSAQYAARALWLQSQYCEAWEMWETESSVPGKVKVDESGYTYLMENNCDDYAYQDVYEHGMASSYSWMVWAIHHEHYDFCSAMVEWAQDHDMPLPTWLEDAEDYV